MFSNMMISECRPVFSSIMPPSVPLASDTLDTRSLRQATPSYLIKDPRPCAICVIVREVLMHCAAEVQHLWRSCLFVACEMQPSIIRPK